MGSRSNGMGMALAGVLIAGCATTSQQSPMTERTTPLQQNTVDFDGVGAGRNTDSGAGRIVAIYGESISRDRESGFGDGAANISQVTFARDGADFDPDINTDGTHIVFASTQHRQTADIYTKSLNSASTTQLTNDPADDMMPEFSPDGQWIAFTSNRGGNWDIYIMPAGGGPARLIAGDTAPEIHPSWSPDGRHLVYCRFGEQSRRWEMWLVDTTNTAVKHFLDYGFLPEWSPDPALNKVLFQRARERGSRFHSVWTVDITGTEARNPTEIVSAANAAIINPSWSPDGGRIVFVSVLNPVDSSTEVPDHSDLWIVNADGSGRVNLTRGAEANFQPCWSRDGRIYFVSDRSGAENLWSVAAQPTVRDDSRGRDAIANVPGEPGTGIE